MFCNNCGAQMPERVNFCSSCGAKILDVNIANETQDVQPQQTKNDLPSYDELKLKMQDDNFKKIIATHAFGAAGAAMAAGWVPAAGSSIAIALATGFIWSMYFRMSNYLGIKISKNVLKILASAVASNLVSTAVATLLTSAALSLIPGVGSVGASVLSGSVSYACVRVSASIFEKIIVAMTTSKKDISQYSEEDLKKLAKDSMSKKELLAELEDAKKEFKRKKESGEFDAAEKATVIED